MNQSAIINSLEELNRETCMMFSINWSDVDDKKYCAFKLYDLSNNNSKMYLEMHLPFDQLRPYLTQTNLVDDDRTNAPHDYAERGSVTFFKFSYPLIRLHQRSWCRVHDYLHKYIKINNQTRVIFTSLRFDLSMPNTPYYFHNYVPIQPVSNERNQLIEQLGNIYNVIQEFHIDLVGLTREGIRTSRLSNNELHNITTELSNILRDMRNNNEVNNERLRARVRLVASRLQVG
jgi:hypothetical protein